MKKVMDERRIHMFWKELSGQLQPESFEEHVKVWLPDINDEKLKEAKKQVIQAKDQSEVSQTVHAIMQTHCKQLNARLLHQQRLAFLEAKRLRESELLEEEKRKISKKKRWWLF
jgi:hypothetical protein